MTGQGKRYVLAAVMFSPNLGDGVIAEGFTKAAAGILPECDVRWLDIAGRTGFGAGARPARTRGLDLLSRLPTGLANMAAAPLVSRQIRNRLVPLLPGAFDDAQGVVIGGGQLLADANLNFPLKIGRIVQEAERRGLPVAIHAVGVSARWSPGGSRRFARILRSPSLCFLSVRDEGSLGNLTRHLERMGLSLPFDVTLYPDAGLLAPEAARHQARRPGARPLAGLGVIHPLALRTHSARAGAPGTRELGRRYAALCSALIAEGFDIRLFTNGGPEDEAMLDHLRRSGHSVFSDPALAFLPRVSSPRALVDRIAALDLVIAHRLHAAIVAYAAGVPHIGLSWDDKLGAFFSMTGRRAWLADGSLPDPTGLSAAARRALAEPIDPARSAALKGLAHEGVAAALNALQARA